MERLAFASRGPRWACHPAALTPLLDDDCGTTCGHHQHAVALAKHLVIEVDAYNGVRSDQAGTLLEFRECNFPGSLQFFLVGGRSTADDVPDACEEVFEDVGAKDSFTGDHATVLDDLSSIYVWRGSYQHADGLQSVGK